MLKRILAGICVIAIGSILTQVEGEWADLQGLGAFGVLGIVTGLLMIARAFAEGGKDE